MTVWEIATGRQLLTFKPDPDAETSAQFGNYNVYSLSGDGKRLAIGGRPVPRKKGNEVQDYEVAATVWDVEKNERLTRVAVKHRGTLVPLLSPDGKLVATWGAQHYSLTIPPRKPGDPELAPLPRPVPNPFRLLRVWDVATGNEITQIRMSKQDPSSVAFSPDSRVIAAAAADGSIEWWDARSGEAKPPLRGQGKQRLVFSPDGKTLAALAFGVDGSIRRWATADGRLLGVTERPASLGRAYPLAIGFAANDRVITWGGGTSMPFAYEAPSGKVLSKHGEHNSAIVGIGFSAGGKEVITSELGARLVRWDAVTGKPVGSITVQPKPTPNTPRDFVLSGVIISPDATRALSHVSGVLSAPAVVYDPATGAELSNLPAAPKDSTVEYRASADLSRVVVLPVPPDPKATTAAPEVLDAAAGSSRTSRWPRSPRAGTT